MESGKRVPDSGYTEDKRGAGWPAVGDPSTGRRGPSEADHRLLETDTDLVRGAKGIEDLNTEGNGILVLGSGRLERGESHGNMLEGLS